MRSFIWNLNIICLLALCSFACNRHSSNLQLQQIDSLLEERPDTALLLLKNISSMEEMPDADKAYYALLMVQAMDKNELPLLPCDSLLDFASDYYGDDDQEMAVALLYKGRLLAQMGDTKEAINCNLKALKILDNHPTELKLKRLIYSALGMWYEDIKAYDKALEMQQKTLQVSLISKDSILALSNMSIVYCLKENLDSTIRLQKKTLAIAIMCNDSNLIATCFHNLSFAYHYFDRYDSAMKYAHMALHHMPFKYKNRTSCYYNLGDLYLSNENYDSAALYLNQTLPEPNIKKKAVTYRTLSYLEKELGHYENAFNYMEQYVIIDDSVTEASQVSEIQHLVYKHQTEMEVEREQRYTHRLISILTLCSILACSIIVLLYQQRLNHKKKLQLQYERSLGELRYKLSFVQKTIEENETVIHILRQSQENKDEEIQQREQTIEQLKEEKLKLRIWLLEQSAIYKKIVTLSQQEVKDKNELQVLKTTELNKLRQVVFEIYADYINSLQTEYSKLTEDDLLYLCLQLTDLSTLSIARCFGYTNTQPINQRKLRIKEKMRPLSEQML